MDSCAANRAPGARRAVTPEFWAIIGVGMAIIGVVAGMFGRLDAHVRGQGERLARLEGKVDTLIAAFVKPHQQ